MNTLYIIRGLPGSGKSTLAKEIVKDYRHFEADMFHVDSNGVYKFDPSRVRDSHEWCKARVDDAMAITGNIAVSNTFTQRWEYQPYIDMADKYGWDVHVIESKGEWGSIHNVPESVINAMRDRWEEHKTGAE